MQADAGVSSAVPLRWPRRRRRGIDRGRHALARFARQRARDTTRRPTVDVVDAYRHPAFPHRRIMKIRTVVRTLLYVKGGPGAAIAADAIATTFWTKGS